MFIYVYIYIYINEAHLRLLLKYIFIILLEKTSQIITSNTDVRVKIVC